MAAVDWLKSTLASYSLAAFDVTGVVLSEASRRVVDSVGVALGALDHAGPVAIRRYISGSGASGDAVVWGSSRRAPLESAVLANCAAVRYLDYNDSYFAEASGSHPSDMIPGLMAIADSRGASGRALLEAIAVGYEIAVSCADGIGARRKGWDHVNQTGIGACCALGRLLGLSPEQLGHALGIVVVSHAAMGQTREGHLSMWKGLAAADAVRHAVYACLLAEAGVEGPDEPFSGERGYLSLILGGEYVDKSAFEAIAVGKAPARILETHIKAWPIGVVSQSGVDAALRLALRLDGLDQVESVEVETFRAAIERNGSPEKWRPMTRETADHSLPFGVVTALRDGRVNPASFEESKVQSEVTHQFMLDRVTLMENPEFTGQYPEAFPTRVTVRTRSGDVLVEEVVYPRGHARNPLSEEALDAKFTDLVAPVLGADRSAELLTASRALGNLESLESFSELMGTLSDP